MKKRLFSILLVICLCFTTLFGSTISAFALYKTPGVIDLDETTGSVLISTTDLNECAMDDYDLDENKSPWYDNNKVKTVIIDKRVINVSNYAFTNCTNLESISLSSSVATIGEGAFKGCTGLNNIRIPSSVDTIGKEAFMDCTNIQSIVFEGNSFPALGDDAFTNINEDCVIYVYTSLVPTVLAKGIVKSENIIGFQEPYNRDDALTAISQISKKYTDACSAKPEKAEEMAVIYNRLQRILEGNYDEYDDSTYYEMAQELGTAYFEAIQNNSFDYDVLKTTMELVLGYVESYRLVSQEEKAYVTAYVGAELLDVVTSFSEDRTNTALDYFNIIHMYLDSKTSSSIETKAIVEIGVSTLEKIKENFSIYNDYLLPASNNLIAVVDQGNTNSAKMVEIVSSYLIYAIKFNTSNYEKLFGAFNVLMSNSTKLNSEEVEAYANIASSLFETINVDTSAYDEYMGGTDLVYNEILAMVNLMGLAYDSENGISSNGFIATCKVCQAAIPQLADEPHAANAIKGYMNNFIEIAKTFSGYESVNKYKAELLGRIGSGLMGYLANENSDSTTNYVIGITNLFASATSEFEFYNIEAFTTDYEYNGSSMIDYIIECIIYTTDSDKLNEITAQANLFLTILNKYENYGSYAVGYVGTTYFKALSQQYSYKDDLNSALNVVLTAINNETGNDYERRTVLGNIGREMFNTLSNNPQYCEQFVAEFNILSSVLHTAKEYSVEYNDWAIQRIGMSYYQSTNLFQYGKNEELVSFCNTLLAYATLDNFSNPYAAMYVSKTAIQALNDYAPNDGIFDKVSSVINIVMEVCKNDQSRFKVDGINKVLQGLFTAYSLCYDNHDDLVGMLNQLLTLIMAEEDTSIAYDIAELGYDWFYAINIDNTINDILQAKFNIVVSTFEGRSSSETSPIGLAGGAWLKNIAQCGSSMADYYDNVFTEVVKYVNCFDQENRDCYGYIAQTLFDVQSFNDQSENFELFGLIVGQLNNIAHFDILEYSDAITGELNPADLMKDYLCNLMYRVAFDKSSYDDVRYIAEVIDQAIKIDSQVSITWSNTGYYWLGTFRDICTYSPPAPEGDGNFLGWISNYTYDDYGMIEDMTYGASFDYNPGGGGGGDDPVVPGGDDPVVPSKVDPTYTVPTGLTANVGDTLSDVPLPTGFTYQDPTTTSVGSEGVHTFKVTYTPDDIDTYNVIRNINVTITVTKETPEYTVPTGLTAEYGDYIKGIELPDGFTFQDDPTTKINEVGTITLLCTYTPEDTTTYSIVKDIQVTIKVEKADPDYEIGELVAIKGQTLGDVTLPEGFTFNDSTTKSVGSVGTHEVLLTFTPSDTTHYNVLNNVVATLNVVKDEEELNEKLSEIESENKDKVSLPEQEGVNSDEVSIVAKLYENPEEVLKSSPIDYNSKILDLKDGETVGFVYSTKLMRTINGVSTEIQPKDLGLNSVKVRLLMPKNVDYSKITRFVQVLSDGRLEEYPFDQSKITEDGYYEVDAIEFNEFAFLTEADAFTDDDKDEDGCRVHILFMIYALALIIISLFAIIKRKKNIGLIAAIVYLVAVGITAFFMGCSVCTTWLIIDAALLLVGMLVTSFRK